MNLTFHIAFDGCCEEAFRLYERCLGGKLITMLKWSDTPMAAEAPPGFADKILHATLQIGASTLAGADSMPDQYEAPKGFHVLLGIADPTEAERVFAALAEGGNITVPLQKTFWAAVFGVVTDRFGVSWEINCETAPLTHE
jgi:PhnB protein